jgi:hypothetical protein
MTSSIARKKGNGLLPFYAIFLFALAVRVWFNFGTTHPNAAFAADAAEYLRDAQSFDAIFRLSPAFWGRAGEGILNGPQSAQAVEVRADLAPYKELATSGPVLPLLILASSKIGGTRPDFSFWQMPVLTFCLISSLTCLLIALIGRQCWTANTGYLAGFFAAVYPGFIVNTGRLYNEPLATFLGCFILYLVIGNLLEPPKAYAKIILIGFSTACLQVTRSIMAVLSLLLIPLICLFNKGKSKQNLLGYALGFALLVLPWLGLQQSIFGKSSLVIDRYGHFNLLIGNNLDTQGWFSFPYPEYGYMDKRSIPQIVEQTVFKNPVRWIQLALGKPARLLKRPWNDFKTAIGCFDYDSQIALHQILLAMAAIGLIGGLFLDFNKTGSHRIIFARSLLFTYFLFHFVYAIFIAVPRYESTALPIVILFAAASLTFLSQTCRTKAGLVQCVFLLLSVALLFVALNVNTVDILASVAGEKTVFAGLALQIGLRTILLGVTLLSAVKSAKLIKEPFRPVLTTAVLLFITVLPSIALNLRAHGRWLEWNRPFDQAGTTVTETIAIPRSVVSDLNNRQGFLMVYLSNGNNINNDLKIAVNDTEISAPIVPAMAFAQELDQLNKLPNGVIMPEPDFIVDDILAHTGKNELDLRGWYLIPLTANQLTGSDTLKVKLEKISNRPNRIFGAYRTQAKSTVLPSVGLYAWEKGFWGVEGEADCNDLTLDEKIPTPKITNAEISLSSFPPHPYIHLLLAPLSVLSKNICQQVGEFHSETATEGGNGLVSLNVPVHTTLACPDKSVVFARVIGEHLPTNRTLQLSCYFKDKASKVWTYPCHWLPKSLTASATDFTFPITLKDIPGKLTGFNLTMVPAPAVPNISISKGLGADSASAAENHDKTQISVSMPGKAPPAPPSVAGLQSSQKPSTGPVLTVQIYAMPINPTAPGHEIL